MSITDELREWSAKRFGKWTVFDKKHLEAIADRIDKEHEAQMADAFDTRNSDENLETDGYIKLPVDRNSEVIRVGSLCKVYPYKEPAKRVRALRVSRFGWFVIFEDGTEEQRYRVMVCKPPTIGDVLDEYLADREEMGDRDYCVDDDARAAWDRQLDELNAEYAKRLQLREVDE